MFTVGMTAAPRDIVYTGQALESFHSEFKHDQFFVFEEPNTHKYIGRSKCQVFVNDKKLGCVLNWLNMIESLLTLTNTQFIMTLEDDIQWQPGAGKKVIEMLHALDMGIEGLELDKIGFISPYCSQICCPTMKGWRPPRTMRSGWCGALAMIFPRHTLEKILKFRDEFLLYTIDDRFPEKGFIHLDYAIGRFVQERRLKIITHRPTLVQHIGDCSTLTKNNNHPHRQPGI